MMRNSKNGIYQKLMYWGKCSGCHQMPERSFFIKGKQFPICARCTGVLIGNIAAYIMFLIAPLPVEFCLMGCALMFADWYLQYIKLCESTNIRRLITGIVGGYSLAMLQCKAVKYAIQILFTL